MTQIHNWPPEGGFVCRPGTYAKPFMAYKPGDSDPEKDYLYRAVILFLLSAEYYTVTGNAAVGMLVCLAR
jgi:hypothetical protein